jgi:hypothetical protein
LFSCQDEKQDEQAEKSIVRVTYMPESEKPLVVFVLDSTDESGMEFEGHIRKTLDYSKIPYQHVSLVDLNKNPVLKKTTRVLVVCDIEALSDVAIATVIEFVVGGGTLFLPEGHTDSSYGFFAGVKKDASYRMNIDAQGLDFKVNILPDFKDKIIKNPSRHYGLEGANFKKNIEVLVASNSNPDFPVILKNRMGLGKVIAFNTQLQPDKKNRGIYFASMLYGLSQVPYPIANVNSIFLDDFPAPLYNIKMEPVISELNVSQSDFYTDYWWPDLLKLAHEENLEYTAYVCFDYRNLIVPPFNYKEWEFAETIKNGKRVSAPDWLMKQVSGSKHELGLHGYNHVSLLKKDWGNSSYMGLSLQAVRKRWEARDYGSLPTSYVPPSNDIDSTGMVILAKNMPSLEYNSSLYLGEFEAGGAREFDPEPYTPQIFNYPRITSGYLMNNSKQFAHQSLYLYTGIWTHFIHADDIFQIPENNPDGPENETSLRNMQGYSWRISKDGAPGLLPRFKDYIVHTNALYPLARYLTVNKAAPIAESWRNATFEHSAKNGTYIVKNTVKKQEIRPFYWFVYSEKNQVKRLENDLQIRKIRFNKIPFLDGFLFNMETKMGQLTIPTEKVKKPILLTSINFEAYKNFVNSKVLPGKDNETQINELKTQLAGSAVLSEKTWLSLFKYLGWEGREQEIWPLLENKYTFYKSKGLALLANKFVAHSDYPNMETRKRWMQRQVENDSENTLLKVRYISYFGEDQNVQIAQPELTRLLENENSASEKAMYINMLIQKHPETATSFLEKINVENPDYKQAGESIMWFFADHANYEKAIAWSKKAQNIDEKTVDDWRLQIGEYEFLKEKDFPKYINYLLSHNAKKASAALIDETPCTRELLPQATNIAYAYGGQGSYRKAIAWSACAIDFPVVNRLQWYYSLKNNKAIDSLYEAHLQNNIPSETLKGFMADYYISRANFKAAWKMAESLEESEKREALRLQYNKDVVFASTEDQQRLMEENPGFFYPEVLAKIKKDQRISTGDFLELSSKIISDRLDPTSLGNAVFYGIRDSRLNTHKFGISQFKAYPLTGNFDPVENRALNLYGVVYQFKELTKPDTIGYGAGGKVEFDESGKVYYHVNASASVTVDSLYASAQIFRRPANTGPAYRLGIYQTQLNIYSELRMKKNYQAIFYLEGNQFDDRGALDVTALVNFGKNFRLTKNSKFKGYAEISGMLGNTNQRQGYPYWTIDERLYGGLGAGYYYANSSNNLQFSLDASFFLDTFSEQFQRYRGQLSVPLFDYLRLEANAEFFTLKDFYSNSFGIGLRYYLN